MKLQFIQSIHVAATLLHCPALCPGTARDLTPCMLLVLVVTCQSSATFKSYGRGAPNRDLRHNIPSQRHEEMAMGRDSLLNSATPVDQA